MTYESQEEHDHYELGEATMLGEITPHTDWKEEVLNKMDAEIMDWVYQVIEVNFGAEMVQDSTELREIIQENIDSLLLTQKEQLTHDHEILVNTILDTQKQDRKELKEAVEKASYFLPTSRNEVGVSWVVDRDSVLTLLDDTNNNN